MSARWRLRSATRSGCLVLLLATSLAAADAPVDFNRQIRPILSNRCFQCHGPDQGTREADLRLDTKDGIFAERDEHTLIVAGKPDESELFRRVSTDNADDRMPPADADQPALTPAEIDLIRRWIAEEAEWQEHWAFIPPVRPSAPVDDTGWSRNDIDRFVFAKLREHKLVPADEARRETLLRRVTFDLTGLPPTVEEVENFLADKAPDAYEKLVDRLLLSPHYGEHMTRQWLDLARYGDTHGLHLDNVRSLWPYRDWLIQAFNDNKPFDRMTIEQLAGDLLEDPTRDQRVATGFNRCNVTTSEGGSIAEEYYVRYAVDRTSTMGTVFLGLTLGCSVCHDHKFDPISQPEFYSLFAFFNSIDENPMDGNALAPPPFIELPTPEQAARRVALQEKIDALQGDIDAVVGSVEYVDPQPDATAVPKASEFVWVDDAVPSNASIEQSSQPWEFVSAPQPVHAGEKSMRRSGTGLHQHFFTGAAPPMVVGRGTDTFFVSVYLDPENPPRELMLQFNDGGWEHRAYWGENLIEWGYDDSISRQRIGDLPPAGEWTRLEVTAQAVGVRPGTKINGWAFTQFDGTAWWDAAGIVSKTPQPGQTFESQRLWELAAAGAKDLPDEIQKALKVPPAERDEAQQKVLRRHFLELVYPATTARIARILTEREALKRDQQAIDNAVPKTMVMQELPEPKPAFVLNRGEYDKPAAAVTRSVPSSLPPLPADAPLNRLGLAEWLVSSDHPLTSRVTVNRFWQRYFGTGLVKTSEDLGIQGESPSHPELLDWLAREFIESDWDVKHLQKLIVMSAAYRQAATVTPEKLHADPENRLISRGPRFRLDAESIRDLALAASGLLNDEIGGPSVKPYQPSGLWEAVGYTTSNTAQFVQDKGEKLYRRSMYTFWKRTSHPPSMAIFDAPSREACVVRRARTNTPLQALALMNDKQFVEASREFAQRVLREGGSGDEEKLSFAFEVVTGRKPAAQELSLLRQTLEAHRADFRSRPDAAKTFLDSATTQTGAEAEKRDGSQDPELAAWTMLTSLLLNLDETVTRG